MELGLNDILVDGSWAKNWGFGHLDTPELQTLIELGFNLSRLGFSISILELGIVVWCRGTVWSIHPEGSMWEV